MAGDAIVNPDDLEGFARDLAQFNRDLAESLSNLRSRFDRLGDTWRDQQHQRFAGEFEEMARVLAHFQGAADEQIPLLVTKARIARDYLQHR